MFQPAILSLESTLWTVSKLNRHIRQLLETDYRLQDLWVGGEVSNVSRPASGHLYFSLVDGEASLRCVMWKSEAESLEKLPESGESVEVHGHVSVYEAGGQYQLYVDELRPAGEGALYRDFLRLREKLEKEGLFDPDRKRALPKWPDRIGVVTSPTGAALQDVINVLRRRYPLVELILAGTTVQGEGAPEGIVEALQALNATSAPDLILLVRGGGSTEDLWAFNHEQVVRAVASSSAPVVSGIGHETDVILTDYAADVRAPTPSAAAEICTPDQQELKLELAEQRQRLANWFRNRHRDSARALNDRLLRLRFLSPRAQISNSSQRLDEVLNRALAAMRSRLALEGAGMERLAQALRVVGPPAVLARGYAIVSKQRKIVRSVNQVQEGDRIDIRVSDGSFPAEAADSEQA
jgi:exodeoxyribonuclease VII large subunit